MHNFPKLMDSCGEVWGGTQSLALFTHFCQNYAIPLFKGNNYGWYPKQKNFNIDYGKRFDLKDSFVTP